MKFLTFDNLFDKSIHITKIENLEKFYSSLHKIINNSCIINLTYTSIYLYKLYKIFYILSCKHLYVTLINSFKFYNNVNINLLLKFTNNNFFNSKYWINGIITNSNILKDILLLGLWSNHLYLKNDNKLVIPNFFIKLQNKIEYICLNLKFKQFSKFIFLLNSNNETHKIKELISSNRFIIGIYGSNNTSKLLDFVIYSNNLNEISLNFIIKFITIASINGNLYNNIYNKNRY